MAWHWLNQYLRLNRNSALLDGSVSLSMKNDLNDPINGKNK